MWYGMPVIERQGGDGPVLHYFGPWWLWPVKFPVPLVPVIAALALTFVVLVNGWLPLDDTLIKAAAAGKTDKVRQLLPLKRTVRWSMVSGKSALGEAARAGHVEVVRLLTAVGDRLERRDEFGRTALIRAAENGRSDVARVLLEAGASADAVDLAGWDAFRAACETGHPKTAELIRTWNGPARSDSEGSV
jgi:ankyrin repeat protein